MPYSRHMRTLITGHTGFKGSWMALLLAELGHEVHGISDMALPNSHFQLTNVERVMSSSKLIDVRDKYSLRNAILKVKPDVVIHLAAQAFVLEGYRKPFDTFEINVNGTINVLESCEAAKVNYLLVVTSDKVYKTNPSKIPFVESDTLGGFDPYSSSKAAADLITQTLSRQLSHTRVSIARAGNVIGGGDFGANRLIPDLYRAHLNSEKASIRNPNSIRPWQHVLDCLDAYILIIKKMIESNLNGIWNVGPDSNILITVKEIADRFSRYMDNQSLWKEDDVPNLSFAETELLSLNSQKIRRELSWEPKLDVDDSVKWTGEWYKGVLSGTDPAKLTSDQISQYLLR